MKKKILAMLLAMITTVTTFSAGGVTAFAEELDAEEYVKIDTTESFEEPSTTEDDVAEILETEAIESDVDMAEDTCDENTDEAAEQIVSDETKDSEAVCIHIPEVITTKDNEIITKCTYCGEILSKAVIADDEDGSYTTTITDENGKIVDEIRTIITDTNEKTSVEFKNTQTGTSVVIAIENRVEATCRKSGSFEIVVYTDGKETSRYTIHTALGCHNSVENKIENEVAPTCKNDGNYDIVTYCPTCGEEISRITKTVPATGHQNTKTVIENMTAPGHITEGGYDEVVYCADCGLELSRIHHTVEAEGHIESEAVQENVVDSTTTGTGHYDSVVYCKVCGKELSREIITIPKKEATIISDPVVTEPIVTTPVNPNEQIVPKDSAIKKAIKIPSNKKSSVADSEKDDEKIVNKEESADESVTKESETEVVNTSNEDHKVDIEENIRDENDDTEVVEPSTESNNKDEYVPNSISENFVKIFAIALSIILLAIIGMVVYRADKKRKEDR